MFEQELAQREQEHLLRRLRTIGSGQGPRVLLDGREVVLLCSNSYLGLAEHPALARAASLAMERAGFGSGASRLLSGSMTLHDDLERGLARFKGTEAALVFNSGYEANLGVIPALAGAGDALFSDELNHASIIDGCRLSRARTFVYRHADPSHLEDLLKTAGLCRRKVIVSDGVFSMDGDIAPLPDLVALAERHGAILMIDDAHATGVLGRNGRGTAEHFGLEGRVPVQMGTLGKALGSYGAYIAGSADLIAHLVNTARTLIFSTSLPPSVCAASLAALDLLQQEPWRRDRLWSNRARFVEGLARLGISTGRSATPIVPVTVGEPGRALSAAHRLLQLGIFAPAIRPPSVPPGSSRIRTTVMATHSDADIDAAVGAFGVVRDEGLVR